MYLIGSAYSCFVTHMVVVQSCVTVVAFQRYSKIK